MFDKLISRSASRSPWLFHINTGSCNGCDIEIVATLTPRFDAERFGFKLAGSPRHADIVVVSGPVTLQSKDRLIRTLAQVPEPKCVVSVGSCPQSGNVFKGSYGIDGPLEKYVHVDVAVAGCTPKPEAIMEGLYKAALILEQKREAMRKGGREALKKMEEDVISAQREANEVAEAELRALAGKVPGKDEEPKASAPAGKPADSAKGGDAV